MIDRSIDRPIDDLDQLFAFGRSVGYLLKHKRTSPCMLTRKCEHITSGDKTTSIHLANCALCRKLEGDPISSLMINQNIAQKKSYGKLYFDAIATMEEEKKGNKRYWN